MIQLYKKETDEERKGRIIAAIISIVCQVCYYGLMIAAAVKILFFL